MSVALKKVDGVTAATVTLKEGRAKLTLRAGNTVTLAELRRLVERKGFTPQAATVVAEVEEAVAAARPALRISGTAETFPISAVTTDKVRADIKKQTGTRFLIDAVVRAPKDNPTGAMDVKTVKPSAN